VVGFSASLVRNQKPELEWCELGGDVLADWGVTQV
jgi:hypothetical protein